MQQAEQDAGKKLDTQQLEKVAAQMFTKVGVKGILGFTFDKPAVLVDKAKDSVVVPDADRQEIMDAWAKARPGQRLSEEDILGLYKRQRRLM